MALEDDIRFFAQVPTLGILGDQALRILAIGAEMRFLPKNTVLFHAGDLADCGYIVQDGSFELEPTAPVGGEIVVAGPGTLLGEIALMVDTVRPATATAREPSTVLRVPRSLFLKMLEGYPDAARRLRDSFAARTDQWSRELNNVRMALDSGGRVR
ncbi:MAG: cyclic nucleotide-binding domain-containing protein [Pseudolabrys sp.]